MEPLTPGYYYHIYNHANGSDLLFKEEKNYLFFLEKYTQYIVPVADTMAYCLMPNHFHLLVRIKQQNNLMAFSGRDNTMMKKYRLLKLQSEKDNLLSTFISKQFANLFSAYTQAFNKLYNRKGSLFMKNFKRKRIDGDNYFTRLVNYIHLNPVNHGFTSKPQKWGYSSYNAILSDKPTWVKQDEILKWFGDADNFKYCHLKPMKI